MPRTPSTTRHHIAEGLRILMRCGGLDACGCDFQRLYVGGPEPESLGTDDRNKLDVLGWHWERIYGCWVIHCGGKEGLKG